MKLTQIVSEEVPSYVLFSVYPRDLNHVVIWAVVLSIFSRAIVLPYEIDVRFSNFLHGRNL